MSPACHHQMNVAAQLTQLGTIPRNAVPSWLGAQMCRSNLIALGVGVSNRFQTLKKMFLLLLRSGAYREQE